MLVFSHFFQFVRKILSTVLWQNMFSIFMRFYQNLIFKRNIFEFNIVLLDDKKLKADFVHDRQLMLNQKHVIIR